MEWSPWNNKLGKFFSYITPNDWTRIDIDSTILSSGSAAQRDSHEEKSTDNKQRISKASVIILQKYKGFENLNYWLIRFECKSLCLVCLPNTRYSVK